jgi:hypothetical protein
MILLRLIIMCLTETYSRVRLGKRLSNIFPVTNSLKQEDNLSSMFFNYAVQYATGVFQEDQSLETTLILK